MDSDKYLEGQSMQRPPLFESDSFIYWKNRFETYVKSKDLDLWHVITNGDFQPIVQNPETKLDEVIPFEKQTDDLKKRLAKNNEALLKQRPHQTWISKMAKLGKPPTTFDELMSTPIYFSAYVLHNLNIENLTQEHLVGPAFNLLKGTCKSQVELKFHFEECYKDGPKRKRFYAYACHWKSSLDVFSTKRIISITHVNVVKKYDYGYLDEIIVRREDHKLYKFKEGDFPRLNLRDIEDMLLFLVQKKLSNLEKDDLFDLNMALWMFTKRVVILKRVEDLQLGVKSYQKKLNITKPKTFRSDITKMTPYTAYNDPQGIIYQDKFQRNRLMRLDELYKFCDGTLSSVRRVLHDIASSLEMDYLPKRIWSKLDKKRSRIMIKAIDQHLFERRLMRNLEKFIGGREYGNDFRLLERTI
ncbi:hypothetical protein Tco_0326631 [Tanacetum coccineum]